MIESGNRVPLRLVLQLALAAALAAGSIGAPVQAARQAGTAGLPKDLRTMIGEGGTDLDMGCAAYLSHYASQVPAARRAHVVALSRSYMARVRKAIGEESAAQYNASTFAVLNDNTPAEVAAASNWCEAHKSAAQSDSSRKRVR